MSNTGKDLYNEEWEDPHLYPKISQWIQRVNTGSADDIHYYKCKVCRSNKLSLSNMAIGALKKHH